MLSASSLLLSSGIIIAYKEEAFGYSGSIPALIIFSAIIISFWSVVYAIITLGIIFLYNHLRDVPSWNFIKTEIITLSITILSSILFILTTALFGAHN